jgi:phosphate starvation-inducible membrane PsiE
MPAFFERRERLHVALRILITVAIPTLVSLLITNQDRVTDTALKEQFVVLLGLALAYLMLSPKGGVTAAAAPDEPGETT